MKNKRDFVFRYITAYQIVLLTNIKAFPKFIYLFYYSATLFVPSLYFSRAWVGYIVDMKKSDEYFYMGPSLFQTLALFAPHTFSTNLRKKHFF